MQVLKSKRTYRILQGILGVHGRSDDHREARGVPAGIRKEVVDNVGDTDNVEEDTYGHGADT